MRNGRAIETQRTGDDGSCHCRAAGTGGTPRLVNLEVGLLYQPLQQRRMRLTGHRLAKTRDYAFNRDTRSYFALVMAADAIGYCEQPTMRMGACWSVGRCRPQ